MTDAPGPDIAAQIAAVRYFYEHYYSCNDKGLRAALRTLEAVAAMVAADMIEPGLIARLYRVAKGQMP